MDVDAGGRPGVRASRPYRTGPAHRQGIRRTARPRLGGPLTAGFAVAGLAAGLALAPALPAGAAARGRGTIGGPQLTGRGVIVNYPAAKATPLPKGDASARVIADAATGHVLATKDPPPWYVPPRTLPARSA